MERLTQRATGFAEEAFYRGLSYAGRLHPQARPRAQGVEVIEDVPYSGDGERAHLLDVYRPLPSAGFPRPWPVVLYVHGGAFRMLSKDTHWVFGLAYARRGCCVLNINYRLAPRHPFPAAVEDVCGALGWLKANASAYGGDPGRLVLAGESAGANLVTALTLALCYRREEPWARAAYELGLVPGAVVAACGLYQVTDPGRFARRRRLPRWLGEHLSRIDKVYLPPNAESLPPGALDLADPLLLLERGDPPDRPLPPFLLPVGTKDPLLDDTRRLAAALERLGTTCEARYYEGEVHAFHAVALTKQARRCWGHTYAFLDRSLHRPTIS